MSFGTSTRSYVVYKHDQRKCAAPACQGYWIADINRATTSWTYVTGFEFVDLLPEHQGDATGAPDYGAVLYGKLSAKDSKGFQKFIVTTAWRGMPGATWSFSDTFYGVEGVNVQCITAPCPQLRATKLHTTQKTGVSNLDIDLAVKTRVDGNWLANRVINGGALVVGIIMDGDRVGTGYEKVLVGSQVFVKLPDQTKSCPRISAPFCASNKIPVWTRDADRCQVSAGCGGGGACAQFVPTCDEFYDLVSWTGGEFACTQYACEPSFLHD
ncbi:MAG: hypothetical protein QM767_15795 [Anaeromyxobacter sp.]